MWRLTCILLIIRYGSGQELAPKQLNATKDESNISKRYILAAPQYNSLLYTNSQVLPTEQLIFGNPHSFPGYINNFQVRAPYDIVPNYYFLPRSDYVQNIVPQVQSNIVPIPQVVQQKIVPQQVISQQVVPQQVVPQQVVPHQVVPQRSVPQIVPQQLVVQQSIPQPIVPQREIPQQTLPQRVVLPQQVVQYENTFPSIRQHQQVVPSTVPAQQQQVPYSLSRTSQTPVQYQVYQPQPRPQVVVGNEPYPYEVPPGQSKIPLTVKQPPVYVRPQVYSLPRSQNVYASPNSYLQQGTINSQPQTVYVNPNLQTPGGTQQVVRIGYSHPQQQVLYNNQPHTVYTNPNLQTSPSTTQQVVRIGFGHPQLNQDEIFEDQNGGHQRVKYAIPVTFRVVPNQASGANYLYENNYRSTRTVSTADNGQVKQKESDLVKA